MTMLDRMGGAVGMLPLPCLCLRGGAYPQPCFPHRHARRTRHFGKWAIQIRRHIAEARGGSCSCSKRGMGGRRDGRAACTRLENGGCSRRPHPHGRTETTQVPGGAEREKLNNAGTVEVCKSEEHRPSSLVVTRIRQPTVRPPVPCRSAYPAHVG